MVAVKEIQKVLTVRNILPSGLFSVFSPSYIAFMGEEINSLKAGAIPPFACAIISRERSSLWMVFS